MPGEVLLLREALVANFTLERSRATVDTEVALQIGGMSKAFIAHLALIWPFSGMGVEVVLEGKGAAQRLAADVAGIHRCGGQARFEDG